MKVIDQKPIPIYEIECFECHSKIQYKAAEISFCHITCPVCGIGNWAYALSPVNKEELNMTNADRIRSMTDEE